MRSSRWRIVLAPFLLSLLLFTTACGDTAPPSRYDQVQKESSGKKNQSVAKEAVQGDKFNKFFPKSGGGYQATASQEKKGFAEYKLKKGGKDVAVLSVNDTISTPDAAAKYKSSTKKIGGYPAVDIGNNGSGLLVNSRFQVKVQSRDASFSKSDREAWLQKFNLSGLAQLK